MAVPTAYNPKRLADYGFAERGQMTARGRRLTGRGRRIAGRVLSPGQPTRSEIEAASSAKYKDYVKRDIDASQKRRTALENMWKEEEQRELAARKQAVEEYRLYAEGAPDPDFDTEGVQRAAYFNTPLGRSVTGNLGAHIQASMDKRRQQDPDSPENRGPTQGEFDQAKTVGESFTGFGRKVSEGTPPKAPAPGIEFEVDGKTVRTTGKIRMVEGKPKVEVMHKGKLFAVDPEDVPKQAEKAGSTGEYAGSDILRGVGGALAAPFKTKRPFDAPGI